MPGTRDIRIKLERRGKTAAAEAIRKVTKAIRQESSLTLVVPDALAYNTLLNARKDIEKILLEMLGTKTQLRLKRKLQDDHEFSSQMKRLQEFFGGELIYTEPEDQ